MWCRGENYAKPLLVGNPSAAAWGSRNSANFSFVHLVMTGLSWLMLRIKKPEERQGEGWSENQLGSRWHYKTLLLRQKEKPGEDFFWDRIHAFEHLLVRWCGSWSSAQSSSSCSLLVECSFPTLTLECSTSPWLIIICLPIWLAQLSSIRVRRRKLDIIIMWHLALLWTPKCILWQPGPFSFCKFVRSSSDSQIESSLFFASFHFNFCSVSGLLCLLWTQSIILLSDSCCCWYSCCFAANVEKQKLSFECLLVVVVYLLLSSELREGDLWSAWPHQLHCQHRLLHQYRLPTISGPSGHKVAPISPGASARLQAQFYSVCIASFPSQSLRVSRYDIT